MIEGIIHNFPSPRKDANRAAGFPFRQDRPGVAIILECASVDEAKKAFADFPLVKAGLIEIDAIPLGPFLNWEMLFAAPRP